MKAQYKGQKGGIAVALVALCTSIPVFAANECRIEYGYHNPSNTNSSTKKEYINSGQTKMFNRNRMNFVKNLKKNRVKFYLTGPGVSNKILSKGQVNPPFGYYLTPTVFVKAKCIPGSGASNTNQTPQILLNALKVAGKSAKFIATQLRVTFNLSKNKVAQMLKAAGFTAEKIAKAIKDAFNATISQVAQALKAAGFAIGQIANALKIAFNATIEQVAKALKIAGYAAAQVASAVKAAFNATIAQVAKALKIAGYAVAQVAAALKTTFNVAMAQVAQALKDAGYAIAQVASALKQAFNAAAQQVGLALKNAFNASAQAIAQALRSAGYTLIDVARTLESLNFNPVEIVKALRSGFNARLDLIIEVLKRRNCYGYARGCGADYRGLVMLLQKAGFKVVEILKVLRTKYKLNVKAAFKIITSIFKLRGPAVGKTLKAAGYSIREISSVTR